MIEIYVLNFSMSSSKVERKLAAIMFTDIAGYTASMSESESKSLELLEKKRSILKPLLKEYNGTFVKEIGDGTLSYFESAVNAATCAVKLQEQTYDDDDMNIPNWEESHDIKVNAEKALMF